MQEECHKNVVEPMDKWTESERGLNDFGIVKEKGRQDKQDWSKASYEEDEKMDRRWSLTAYKMKHDDIQGDDSGVPN